MMDESQTIQFCTACGAPVELYQPYGPDGPVSDRLHADDETDADDLCQRPAFQVCGHPLSEIYQDDDTTPYCTACVKELTRWMKRFDGAVAWLILAGILVGALYWGGKLAVWLSGLADSLGMTP